MGDSMDEDNFFEVKLIFKIEINLKKCQTNLFIQVSRHLKHSVIEFLYLN